MNFVSEYIKYLVNAKGRHGIHSPFVYDLVDCCLQIQPEADFSRDLQSLKKKLSKDRTEIEIEDAGAGSKTLGTRRRINDIYRTASSKGVYADLLYQLSNHYRPKRMLEFGTSLGIGTICLAAGNPTGSVVSVDACGETHKLAQTNISAFRLSNVRLINATFSAFLEAHRAEDFDLIFIDGHHQGDALKKYVRQLLPFSNENTIFVLDDIRWSKDMLDAWNELKESADFHVTLDLFRMGVLIRRPQQVKEHFVVKLKQVLNGF